MLWLSFAVNDGPSDRLSAIRISKSAKAATCGHCTGSWISLGPRFTGPVVIWDG